MERAAVLIGVSRSGGLPELQAVYPGIRSMEIWARQQGYGHVRTITDEGGREVTVEQVQLAIDDLLAPRTVQQLVVYFAGHGVNIGGSEYWLLSRAPRWANQAVNVDSSERLARHCSAEHVVFVSDACRTASAADTVFQTIAGAAVFPNVPPGLASRPVDRFYACTLGTPALETKIGPAGEFAAVYTDALLDALVGEADTILEATVEDGTPVSLVRPRPLQDHLMGEVPRRLVRLFPSGDRSQVPDAIITSRDTAWLSRLVRDGAAPVSGPKDRPAPELTVVSTARDALRDELHGRSGGQSILSEAAPRVPGVTDVLEGVQRTASAFGTDHFESGCGVKVRGAAVTAAESPTATVELIPGGQLVRVTLGPREAADMLLTFDNGTCALVPALEGFLAALTFEDHELVDLSFEPSTTSWRYGAYAGRVDELRSLRALITSANRVGAFRLDPDDLDAVERQMRVAKGVDPSLALYAAYACAELQLGQQLQALAGSLAEDLRVNLFDVALLSGELSSDEPPPSVTPMVPMLAQGWALLDAYRVAVAPPVTELRRHLVPSLWTLFDAIHANVARDALYTAGRIR